MRKQNYQIKEETLEKIGKDPLMQFIINFDHYDFEEIEKKMTIETFFPSLNKIEDNNKGDNIHRILLERINCYNCKMNPIIGKRFKCKTCDNFYFCENCMSKLTLSHNHEFIQLEENEIDEIPKSLLIFYQITLIKKEFNNLKGFFFYKSTKDNYELDILKIFNYLLVDFPKDDKYPLSFSTKLPFYFNLLLCYNRCTETDIYSFCVRAINCITNNLFIIVRPEEMRIGTEKFLIKTINKLLEKKKCKY